MSDLTAVEALRKYQKQCDPEGIEVQVSRQALDEVLDEIERLTAENTDRFDAWREMRDEFECSKGPLTSKQALEIMDSYETIEMDEYRKARDSGSPTTQNEAPTDGDLINNQFQCPNCSSIDNLNFDALGNVTSCTHCTIADQSQ